MMGAHAALGALGPPWLATSGHAHPTWGEFGATTWISVVLASAVVAWVLWKAVLYTLRPGETEPDHIKRMILRESTEGLEISLSAGGTLGIEDARGEACADGEGEAS